jgi:zona occludens toxin (predicted ATPase)
MKTFLKVLRVFFVILGVIFFLIIVTGVYLYQSDFYGVKTIINYEQEKSFIQNDSANEVEDNNPALSAEQESQLKSIGVNPASIPSEISPEMEDCFIQKIGERRVIEIQAGATPTPLELIKAKPCLQ